MTKRVIAQIITREELIDAIALVSEVVFVCISLHSLAVSSLIAGDSSCSSAYHQCPAQSLTLSGCTVHTY